MRLTLCVRGQMSPGVDVVEIVARGVAIGIEDARFAALEDGDLACGQSVGGRQPEQRAGHGVGAVRAAQDQDPPPACGGQDMVGLPRGRRSTVRGPTALLGACGSRPASGPATSGCCRQRLAAAQRDDHGAGERGCAPVPSGSGDFDRDRAVAAQPYRARLGAKMQSEAELLGQHRCQRDPDSAHEAVDEAQAAESCCGTAPSRPRSDRRAGACKVARQVRCFQAFEVGAAQRIRADAEPPERAAEMVLALDHGHAAVKPAAAAIRAAPPRAAVPGRRDRRR